MKKILVPFVLLFMFSGLCKQSFGWGKNGHELTGTLAWHFLDDSTRKIVQDFLGNMSFEEAANWMDDVRSNSYFEFQRTWHYVDFEKGTKYEPTHERDLLTVLHSAIAQIKNYKTIKKKDVKRALLLIFHLVGDMHQPLHCGYGSDRGGNSVSITSNVVSGNLHSVWDTDIILYKGINKDSCLETFKSFDSADIAKCCVKINELGWVYESRSHLDSIYSFQNNFLDKRYVDVNAEVIKKQLVLAGLRLAAIFRAAFNPEAKLPG